MHDRVLDVHFCGANYHGCSRCGHHDFRDCFNGGEEQYEPYIVGMSSQFGPTVRI